MVLTVVISFLLLCGTGSLAQSCTQPLSELRETIVGAFGTDYNVSINCMSFDSNGTLYRAKINVTVAGLDSSEPVECSRKVKIVPDTSLDEAIKSGPYDVVILPGGGGGSKKLSESDAVKQLLQSQEASGGFVAAVCAAPTALLAHGVAKGKQITSHPAVRQVMEESGQYTYTEGRVCRDGTTITSRGPGTCFEFALSIVAALVGESVAKEIAGPMILPQ